MCNLCKMLWIELRSLRKWSLGYLFVLMLSVFLAGCRTSETLDVPDAAQVFSLSASVDVASEGALSLSLDDAVLMALQRNRSLRVEMLEPLRAQTQIDRARSGFDPVLSAEASTGRERTERFPDELEEPIRDFREQYDVRAGVGRSFTTGTDIRVDVSTSATDSDRVAQPQHRVRGGLSLTQQLLRGRGRDVNRIAIRQAELSVDISEQELRGFAEALLAEVEQTYWSYVLAQREMEIVAASVALANKQLAATRERITFGQVAPVEIAAAEAELALREQASIDARSNLEHLRLRLLRYLNPEAGAVGWDREIVLLDAPGEPDAEDVEEVAAHVEAALLWRPELREAHLRLESQSLEVVRTRNGLLPELAFFARLGKTGFADSFGSATSNLDGDSYDAVVGFQLQHTLGRRDRKADHAYARLTQRQVEESLANLRQLIEMDVRSAYNEVLRSRQQIDASSATRRLQESLLRTVNERFEAGLATVLDVVQVQRDLLASEIAEAGATISYQQALTDFYRLEGTLLARRGVTGPGAVIAVVPETFME